MAVLSNNPTWVISVISFCLLLVTTAFINAVSLQSLFLTTHDLSLASLPLESASSTSCTMALLEAMDADFDARRQARIDFADDFQLRKPKNLFDLFEPEANCFSEERFGQGSGHGRYQAYGDGPKFVCGMDLVASKNGDCLVYSIGSNNEIDFEVSVKNTLGCEIHTFDPTVRSSDFSGHNVTSFHEWGLGEDGKNHSIDHGRISFVAKSLGTIYAELGHEKEKRTIDMLKIDCEGCEWTVMPLVFASIARGDLVVDQIQIEVHAFSSIPPTSKRGGGENDTKVIQVEHQQVRGGIGMHLQQGVRTEQMTPDLLVRGMFAAADTAKMRIFHKERNHWGCNGWKCLEYAFASADFLRKANSKYACGSNA